MWLSSCRSFLTLLLLSLLLFFLSYGFFCLFVIFLSRSSCFCSFFFFLSHSSCLSFQFDIHLLANYFLPYFPLPPSTRLSLYLYIYLFFIYVTFSLPCSLKSNFYCHICRKFVFAIARVLLLCFFGSFVFESFIHYYFLFFLGQLSVRRSNTPFSGFPVSLCEREDLLTSPVASFFR